MADFLPVIIKIRHESIINPEILLLVCIHEYFAFGKGAFRNIHIRYVDVALFLYDSVQLIANRCYLLRAFDMDYDHAYHNTYHKARKYNKKHFGCAPASAPLSLIRNTRILNCFPYFFH